MTKAIVNRSYPDKKAIIAAKGDVTYTQLFRNIQQFALLFGNKGYAKVAIYAENSPAWIYAFYAALQNNCIAIPIDFLASAEDVAYIIDDIIMGFVGFLISLPFIGGIIFSAIGIGENTENTENMVKGIAGIIGSIIGLTVVVAILGWLYFALMESSKTQATLGKMALGLKVTDLEGNQISFARATGRYFGKIISGMIMYIGYILAGLTEKKQALHDIMASCLVVRKNEAVS